MNLATKIVVGIDERKSIKHIWRFCIKLISRSIYFKEVKCDHDKIMQIDS